jgi:hypothetical protein
MNSYSAIFIPKINNKLKKIIKGIELLNLINNKINIQTGGSSVAEALVNLLNGTIYIYNTEEYKKMVAKFLKEIALLRAIIIELLSRLPQKDKEKPITDKELDAASSTDLSLSITKKLSKISTWFTPIYKNSNIEIYNPTKDAGVKISLLLIPIWHNNIELDKPQSIQSVKSTSHDIIYTLDNINNIYIIYMTRVDGTIDRFLFSFENNDLRDSKNVQLTLKILYKFIYDYSPLDAYNEFTKWMFNKINTYTQSKISETHSVSAGTISTDVYTADNCKKYNIIYNTSINLNKYITLKIYDYGTTYNTSTQTFGSVPFYIDIYEFISKFINCKKIHIFGNFSAQFYKIESKSTTYMTNLPFNNIEYLECTNVAFKSLNQIIILFQVLKTININIVNKQFIETMCSTMYIYMFFITITNHIKFKSLKTINISSLLKQENIINMCNLNEGKSKSIIDTFLKAVADENVKLTYIN